MREADGGTTASLGSLGRIGQWMSVGPLVWPEPVSSPRRPPTRQEQDPLFVPTSTFRTRCSDPASWRVSPCASAGPWRYSSWRSPVKCSANNTRFICFVDRHVGRNRCRPTRRDPAPEPLRRLGCGYQRPSFTGRQFQTCLARAKDRPLSCPGRSTRRAGERDHKRSHYGCHDLRQDAGNLVRPVGDNLSMLGKAS